MRHDFIQDARTKGRLITLCGAPLTWAEAAEATGPGEPQDVACEACLAIEAAWRFGGFDAAPCSACQLDGEWLPQRLGSSCSTCNGRRWVMLMQEAPAPKLPPVPEHIPGLPRW